MVKLKVFMVSSLADFLPRTLFYLNIAVLSTAFVQFFGFLGGFLCSIFAGFNHSVSLRAFFAAFGGSVLPQNQAFSQSLFVSSRLASSLPLPITFVP
ncbi:MAG: hypothetical protein IK056_10570, partial [Clostridia bacterium]|nr:hypothetical protein [Clostridia bacterium]